MKTMIVIILTIYAILVISINTMQLLEHQRKLLEAQVKAKKKVRKNAGSSYGPSSGGQSVSSGGGGGGLSARVTFESQKSLRNKKSPRKAHISTYASGSWE